MSGFRRVHRPVWVDSAVERPVPVIWLYDCFTVRATSRVRLRRTDQLFQNKAACPFIVERFSTKQWPVENNHRWPTQSKP